MNTKTFNENYELDRKTRAGIRANPKHAPADSIEIMTADGTAYDPAATYHFFDAQTKKRWINAIAKATVEIEENGVLYDLDGSGQVLAYLESKEQ